jgi:hypothetical protein
MDGSPLARSPRWNIVKHEPKRQNAAIHHLLSFLFLADGFQDIVVDIEWMEVLWHARRDGTS